MARDSGDSWHQNPFPPSPVVRLGPSADLGEPAVEGADSGNAHVDTPLVTEVAHLVSDYFTPPAASGPRGRAIALVGEFGLGKSHALREAYRTVRRDHADAAVWIVDEPTQDMGRQYRDRLRGPAATPHGRHAFEELVRDYYALVTAGRVRAEGGGPRGGALEEIASGLQNRTLDPDKVVSALHYDPEVIHADLRGTLGEVTQHRSFATAFALLLNPPFRTMVWNWLAGEEPAAPLRERGIGEAIGPSAGGPGDAAVIDRVFDALVVQGFLHGRMRMPYVLLLDSLEKVLDWPESIRRIFIDAFERLVNIYTSHGGLLVFCTSPAGLRALRPSAHERLVQLWATGLNRADTGRLVAQYLAAGGESVAGATPSTGPFDGETVGLLHELTDGVPREVLKTCGRAWQLSEDEQGRVRRVAGSRVLAAVRELHERVSDQKVHSDVHAALDLGQWRIASHDPVPDRLSRSADGREQVLYWLSPAPNAYLAVVHARSVLLAGDAERIGALVHGLRSAVRPGRLEALLVVNGLVSQAMQDRLSRSIGSRPLVYRQDGFARGVHEALTQLAQRLEGERREGGLVELGERVRRDLEQQSTQLDELREAVTALASDTRPPTGPAAAVTWPPAGPTAPVTWPAPASPRPEQYADPLPGPVRGRFRDALAMLEAVTRRVAGRSTARRTAATPADLSALGCATLVRELTEEFRGAVAVWASTAMPGAPTELQLRELRRICREYETAVEVLPVHLLGEAGQQHQLAPAHAVEALAEEVWGSLSAAVP